MHPRGFSGSNVKLYQYYRYQATLGTNSKIAKKHFVQDHMIAEFFYLKMFPHF